MRIGPLSISDSSLADLCRRHRIARLEAFGSVLREDFRPDSDVDLLVTLEPGVEPAQFDLLWAEADFTALLGRRVELIPKNQLKWVIRDRVLREARPVFSI